MNIEHKKKTVPQTWQGLHIYSSQNAEWKTTPGGVEHTILKIILPNQTNIHFYIQR